MKILSLSNNTMLPHLGAKTRIRWTEGLRRHGHEVTVLQPNDFEILPRLKRGKKFRYAFGAFVKVWSLLSREDFDLIEYYGDEFWLLAWTLNMRKRRALLVAHADGLELLDLEKERQHFNRRSPLKDVLFRLTHERFSKIAFDYADKFVCLCRDDLSYAVDKQIFAAEDAVQIRPGLDEAYLEQTFQVTKDRRIAFTGSWIERKGIRVIPPVIERVLRRFPDYTFHVFGSSGAQDAILAAFHPDLRGRVIVHPKYPVDQLLAELRRCAIYFFPSYSEGWGQGTTEAMTCGCAVVATPTGCCSEMPPGTVLLNAFDDVDGMVRSIASLIEDEPRRLQIARAGYDWARQCRWDPQVDQLAELYRRWGNGRAASAS